jgi:beta-galactosidase
MGQFEKLKKFEIRENFYLDGKPFQIISGAIHYFRIVPEYWKDRLEKLKAMGCNTVETYIPWNVHEPEKGEFHFEGMWDIQKFVKIAEELGLYVILRPSPYICAEWEFGGLPAWLLREDDMRLRASCGSFLRHVEEYYQVLLPLITPLQITEGGPVILMQIENEYGYYANDKAYMEAIKNLMVEGGVKVPLVTSDGPFPENLNAGAMEGILPTGNFGSRTEERFEVLRRYTDGGPLMCTEFWVGWFDHWGNGGHITRNPEESAKDLDKMLELGHVNIYMFEGGTNFGFMNGANYYDRLTPDVTSYDYDALLTEDGQITEKYLRYRQVISKYREIPKITLSSKIERKAYGTLMVQDKVSLFSVLDDLSSPIVSPCTECMEKLGQNYGYILYHSTLDTEENMEKIRLWGANDRANILVDEKPVAILYDRELLEEKDVSVTFEKGAALDILVENMGRVNFGPRMEMQRKGISQCVQINGHIHNNWKQYKLPLDHIDGIDFSKGYEEGVPAFYRFIFSAEDAGDTFLDFAGWGKGVAFINGFNLGRFWEIGPQKRLFIPAPLIKKGKNEIVIFETDGITGNTISLVNEPDVG